MLLQMVYCCIALVVPSIDPSIVSIKKFLFRNARDRYLGYQRQVSVIWRHNKASFCGMMS
jgi:hypothetical protein